MTSTHLWNGLINTSYYHQIKVPMAVMLWSEKWERFTCDHWCVKYDGWTNLLCENFVLQKRTMYFQSFYNIYKDFLSLYMNLKNETAEPILYKKTWYIVDLVIDITKKSKNLGSPLELWICFTPLSSIIFPYNVVWSGVGYNFKRGLFSYSFTNLRSTITACKSQSHWSVWHVQICDLILPPKWKVKEKKIFIRF